MGSYGALNELSRKIAYFFHASLQTPVAYPGAAAALKALPAAELAELRDRGYLEWLYFQMASVSHVSGLVARKNQLLSGVTAARRPAGA